MADTQAPGDPLVVPRPVLARVFHVAPSAIDKWLIETPPVPTVIAGAPGKAAQFSIPDCVAWYVARLKASQGGSGLNPAEERARKDRAQAELSEQTLKVRSGQLLAAQEIEQVWTDKVVAARTAVLGVPTRAKQRLPHLSAADLAELDRLLRDTLEGLANGGADAAG